MKTKKFKLFLNEEIILNDEMKEYFDLLTFLGYKLAPCRNGRAWETPFIRGGDNPFDFNFHGLLWSENRNYDYKKLKEWNNMMKIIEYIISKSPTKKSLFRFTTNKEICWKQIINAIKKLD